MLRKIAVDMQELAARPAAAAVAIALRKGDDQIIATARRSAAAGKNGLIRSCSDHAAGLPLPLHQIYNIG